MALDIVIISNLDSLLIRRTSPMIRKATDDHFGVVVPSGQDVRKLHARGAIACDWQ